MRGVQVRNLSGGSILGFEGASRVRRLNSSSEVPVAARRQHESRGWPGPRVLVQMCVLLRFCRNPARGLERLHVGSLPAFGALHYVELHGLTFLQTLETAGVDCRVMHEDVFTVLTRNKAKALRIVKPLHSTLFHFSRVSWIELRWRNRSDHWQNLAWLGRVLLLLCSVLTLVLVYHRCQYRKTQILQDRPKLPLLKG